MVAVSVLSVLDSLGIRHRVINDEAFARCPFHADNNPSWSINVYSGIHYCFSCGAKGNLAFLIQTITGKPYADCVLQANEAVGHARMDKWREDYESVSFSPQPLKVTEADMFSFIIPPQSALSARNVTDESTAWYNIMWNPKNESWIFPYYDPYTEDLWGWQEKNSRIFRNFPAGTKRSKTLFGYEVLSPSTTAIIVESPIDCAVMYSAGIGSIVASFGAPSVYQIALINEKCDRLVLALDNDESGKSHTRDLIPEAVRMFSNVRVFSYDAVAEGFKAKDPGDMTYDEINNGLTTALPAIEWARLYDARNS